MIKNISNISKGTWTVCNKGLGIATGAVGEVIMVGIPVAKSVASTGIQLSFDVLNIPIRNGKFTINPIGLIGARLYEFVNEVFTSLAFILMWNIFASYNEIVAILMTNIMMIAFEYFKIANIESFKSIFNNSKYPLSLITLCLIVLTMTLIMSKPLYSTWVIINLVVNKTQIQPRIPNRDPFIGSRVYAPIIVGDNHFKEPTLQELGARIILHAPVNIQEDHIKELTFSEVCEIEAESFQNIAEPSILTAVDSWESI